VKQIKEKIIIDNRKETFSMTSHLYLFIRSSNIIKLAMNSVKQLAL